VIIGVGALVAVLTLGDAMQAFVRTEIERFTDIQSVSFQARTQLLVDGEWQPVRQVPRFTTADLADLARTLPEVKASVMQRGGSARVRWLRSRKERVANITAATAGIALLDRTPFAVGRSFTASEEGHNAAVVVLSHKLAEELADGRPATVMLGEWVRIGAKLREVIGIQAPYTGERTYSARLPYGDAASALGPEALNQPPTLTFQARTIEQVDALKSAIEDWLAQRYRDWDRRVEITVAERELEQVNRAFDIMKLFLGLLAGISMLVGGIGIMNIMLASVTERTREIGIRKAIGARPRDIQLQFLTEAVAVSCFGSALGAGLGISIAGLSVLVMRLWTDAEGVRLVVTPTTILIAAGIAVAIGLTFGTYPARRAASLSPIDAIRHE
jgi:putative ABC transport system permease protein